MKAINSLKKLKNVGLLTDRLAQATINAVTKSDSPDYTAKMLEELYLEGFLAYINAPAVINAVAVNGLKQKTTVITLKRLKALGLISGQSAQAMVLVIAESQCIDEILDAFSRLQNTTLLTSHLSQAIIEALGRSSDPINLAVALKNLYNASLLTDDLAPEGLNRASSAIYFSEILIELKHTKLLTGKFAARNNIYAVETNKDVPFLLYWISRLRGVGLLTGRLAQDNFNDLRHFKGTNFHTTDAICPTSQLLNVLKLLNNLPDNVLTQAYFDSLVNICIQPSDLDTRSNEIYNLLLTSPDVLAYAEMHEQEYGEIYTHPFIDKTIQSLRERQAAHRINPNAVFDISCEEARGCFYIIRNLIRRNSPTLCNDIRFLLEIPAVKAIASFTITPQMRWLCLSNEPNELVSLALTIGNQEATEILLTIPEVRRLAEQADFYRDEASGRFDLRRIAQDRESSMHALSISEQKQLEAAQKRYQPLIDEAGGVSVVFEAFYHELEARYLESPATITVNNQSVELPLNWEAFKALKFSENASEDLTYREMALKAYYQHKVHTARRYLSQSNPWMASNASYVEVDPDNPANLWSTFSEYKPLIVLFWLAAIDTNMPPVDGYTLESRLEHFIEELALIGRAHNWDKSRTFGTITEEYDDLDGDKPGCFSGVKRRLFQSVPGNPLLKMLTLDDIKQELRTLVRTHFQTLIDKSEEGRIALLNAWNRALA